MKELSDKERLQVSQLHAQGTYQSELARQFGISRWRIRRMLGVSRPRGLAPVPPKLDADRAEEIRRLYAAGGTSQRALAAKFGISKSMTSGILRGESYAAAGGPTVREPDPRTKWLSPREVKHMRDAFAAGASLTQLSEDFGVSRGSLKHIMAGRTYKAAGGLTGDALRAARQRALQP